MYEVDFTCIFAEIKFPSETWTLKSRIRFGKNLDKGGYETCLYILRGDHSFSDDKFEIKEYNAERIVLSRPIYNSKSKEFSETLLPYRIDIKGELDNKTPDSWLICRECNHQFPITEQALRIARTIVPMELCHCGQYRTNNLSKENN